MAYRYSDEELQYVGSALWESRWSHLVQMEVVDGAPKWTSYPRALDMNSDGAVTISDLGLWIKWLFWLPGDFTLIATMKWATPVARFLEINPSNLTGWQSSLISVLVWLLICEVVLTVFPR